MVEGDEESLLISLGSQCFSEKQKKKHALSQSSGKTREKHFTGLRQRCVCVVVVVEKKKRNKKHSPVEVSVCVCCGKTKRHPMSHDENTMLVWAL